MKLIPITSNTFDWNLLISEVLTYIQASSFETDYVLSLCKRAEVMLFEYTGVVIIPNTYKMLANCNEDLTKKYKSLVLKTDFCNDLVDLEVEYEAGYDIMVDVELKYNVFGIIRGLYLECMCDAMIYIGRYRSTILEIDNDTTKQCCY